MSMFISDLINLFVLPLKYGIFTKNINICGPNLVGVPLYVLFKDFLSLE